MMEDVFAIDHTEDQLPGPDKVEYSHAELTGHNGTSTNSEVATAPENSENGSGIIANIDVTAADTLCEALQDVQESSHDFNANSSHNENANEHLNIDSGQTETNGDVNHQNSPEVLDKGPKETGGEKHATSMLILNGSPPRTEKSPEHSATSILLIRRVSNEMTVVLSKEIEKSSATSTEKRELSVEHQEEKLSEDTEVLKLKKPDDSSKLNLSTSSEVEELSADSKSLDFPETRSKPEDDLYHQYWHEKLQNPASDTSDQSHKDSETKTYRSDGRIISTMERGLFQQMVDCARDTVKNLGDEEGNAVQAASIDANGNESSDTSKTWQQSSEHNDRQLVDSNTSFTIGIDQSSLYHSWNRIQPKEESTGDDLIEPDMSLLTKHDDGLFLNVADEGHHELEDQGSTEVVLVKKESMNLLQESEVLESLGNENPHRQPVENDEDKVMIVTNHEVYALTSINEQAISQVEDPDEEIMKVDRGKIGLESDIPREESSDTFAVEGTQQEETVATSGIDDLSSLETVIDDMCIEVERKFVIQDNTESLLAELEATLLEEAVIKDSYYDSKDYALILSDYWLRKRNGQWELKLPVNPGDISSVTKYREVTHEDQILSLVVDKLTIMESLRFGSLESLVDEQELETFAEFITERKSYGLPECTVVLDTTDFGVQVGEIEVLVASKERIPNAVATIDKMAAKLGM